MSAIRIVLVETSHPGNIGAVARAMKNMLLTDLVLVSPRSFPHAEATSRASGADDILANARVVESLDEALAGCELAIGASARLRTIAWPQVEPRECAALVSAVGEGSRAALVFGREDSGLSNEELERCNYLVHIPTNPDYSSLNIAMAVQVLAYELFLARREGGAPPPAEDEYEPAATADELEGLFEHFERALVAIDFLDPENPRQLLRRLRRLFLRARITRVEYNILRGILTAAEKQARHAAL